MKDEIDFDTSLSIEDVILKCREVCNKDLKSALFLMQGLVAKSEKMKSEIVTKKVFDDLLERRVRSVFTQASLAEKPPRRDPVPGFSLEHAKSVGAQGERDEKRIMAQIAAKAKMAGEDGSM